MEQSLKYIYKSNILDEICGFLDQNFEMYLDLQLQTLWNFSNIIALDDGNFIVVFLNQRPQIINNLIKMLESNNNQLLQNVDLSSFFSV